MTVFLRTAGQPVLGDERCNIVLLAGDKTARLESDEQRTAPHEKPGWAHAAKGLQTREVHATGTCQTRGGHPG